MRRFIPWQDIAFYGGLALMSIIAGVWCALTSQEWNVGKVVALVAVPVGYLMVACVVILGRLFTRPTYVTRDGVAVWATKDGPGEHAMGFACGFFIDAMLNLCEDNMEADWFPRELILRVMSEAKIEWRSKPITLLSRYGWRVKDKAGLQQGTNIMVYWPGSIKESALFHELGHMVRQLVFKQEIDYKHEDKEWWGMISEIQNKCPRC